eukprot:1522320-Prymnesium_polylepis.1
MVGGVRTHQVEGSMELVQTSAWSQDEATQGSSYVQEYTVIIMENLIETVKRLEICKGWDWNPISNSELDVE